jgi:transcription initiation factor TFIID subunit 12
MVATEAGHTKGSAGQASGSAKGNQTKIPFNVIGSPNLKNS